MRREEQKKPKKHQFSLTKLNTQSIITNFGSMALNDIDYLIMDPKEVSMSSNTKLMKEQKSNYELEVQKMQRSGLTDRSKFLSKKNLTTNEPGSSSTSCGSFHSNLVIQAYNYGTQMPQINDRLQVNPQIFHPMNYSAPYVINTSNFFQPPIIYQHLMYPPQVPVTIATSILISSHLNSKKTDKRTKKVNRKKIKEEHQKVISHPKSHHSDTDEDMDIVCDFIMKCPSHIDFIIKNKLEAGRLLSSVNSVNATSLFMCLMKDLEKLIVDRYGNFFVQELLKFLSKDERLLIWKIIKKNVGYFGTHQYAHHVLQSLIELSVEQEQLEINYILFPFFETLLHDANGTRIIQKIIIRFYEKPKRDIIEFINKNFINVVTNTWGVCSIKKYIKSISTESSKDQQQFYQQVLANIQSLVNEKSAHYAILCIFGEWKCDKYLEVLDHLADNFLSYSIVKYASRLIEACLLTENKVSHKS